MISYYSTLVDWTNSWDSIVAVNDKTEDFHANAATLTTEKALWNSLCIERAFTHIVYVDGKGRVGVYAVLS